MTPEEREAYMKGLRKKLAAGTEDLTRAEYVDLLTEAREAGTLNEFRAMRPGPKADKPKGK